jgi:phosphoserine phosphatase
MSRNEETKRKYLFVSDFDQTLSFNDSGVVLSEMLGVADFHAKVKGLSDIKLVQQGGELSYLLLHDPAFRQTRKHHLVEVGKRIRLKANIGLLCDLLRNSIPGVEFELFVISAAPEEVIQSALEGVFPADHIYGTQFNYSAATGEIESIVRVPAGYGKVAVLESLKTRLQVPYDRVVYVGDGSSDIHVMLHLAHRNGLTIAVSDAKRISEIAKRTVLTEDAPSLLVPILEEVLGHGPEEIRSLLQSLGLVIQEWDKGRTDWVTVRPTLAPVAAKPFDEAA